MLRPISLAQQHVQWQCNLTFATNWTNQRGSCNRQLAMGTMPALRKAIEDDTGLKFNSVLIWWPRWAWTVFTCQHSYCPRLAGPHWGCRNTVRVTCRGTSRPIIPRGTPTTGIWAWPTTSLGNGYGHHKREQEKVTGWESTKTLSNARGSSSAHTVDTLQRERGTPAGCGRQVPAYPPKFNVPS